LSTPALLTHNIEKGKFDLRNPSDVFWFNAKKREQMMGIRAKKWMTGVFGRMTENQEKE
jgi:hypothetical protein